MGVGIYGSVRGNDGWLDSSGMSMLGVGFWGVLAEVIVYMIGMWDRGKVILAVEIKSLTWIHLDVLSLADTCSLKGNEGMA